MIRHIVLIRFRADIVADEADRLLQSVHGLKNEIPGIVTVLSGPNSSPEGLGRGYSHGFTIDFLDEAARDVYLPHPAHQIVAQGLVAAADGGIDGVVVFDYQI